LRALAAGHWTGYRGHRELRRYFAHLSLDGSYRSSPSTSWRANASYELGDSVSSRILLDQGVSLPRVSMRSLTGALGLSRTVGAQTSLRIDGRYYRTEFDSPGLSSGDSVRGTVGLQRQLDYRSTAAVEYSVEDVLLDQAGRAYLTHFASLQWTRVLSLRSAILLEAGGSYTPDPARAGLERKESFFGGASFARRVARSNITLFVRREVSPAFGLGISRLELRAGLSATIPVGRAWELKVAASHVHPENPHAAGRLFASTDDAFAAVAWRLGRSLEVSAEAGYRRRGATSTFPRIEAFQGGLFLTLLTPSGGTIAPRR
jgi:hypothetical protein